MSRHLGVIVALVAIVFLSRFSFAQIQLPKPAEPIQNQSGEKLNQHVIDQIKDIRKRVGGSVAEQFKELNLDESTKEMAEQEFERELIRLATQVAETRNPRPAENPKWVNSNPFLNPPFRVSPPKPNHPYQIANGRNWGNMPIRAARPDRPVAKRSSTDLLRAAARRLDELAAELEGAQLYQEADQIRDQAREFWLKAREIKVISD